MSQGEEHRQELETLLGDIGRVATYQIQHAYAGQCPDRPENGHYRDEKCPACKVLLRYDALLQRD